MLCDLKKCEVFKFILLFALINMYSFINVHMMWRKCKFIYVYALNKSHYKPLIFYI